MGEGDWGAGLVVGRTWLARLSAWAQGGGKPTQSMLRHGQHGQHGMGPGPTPKDRQGPQRHPKTHPRPPKRPQWHTKGHPKVNGIIESFELIYVNSAYNMIALRCFWSLEGYPRGTKSHQKGIQSHQNGTQLHKKGQWEINPFDGMTVANSFRQTEWLQKFKNASKVFPKLPKLSALWSEMAPKVARKASKVIKSQQKNHQ